jgi:serine/threonine-protein kinase
MSPEQVSGKRADSRSDIFSLGVVIYEMLTGTSPFVADNIHGVMYQTMNFTPPSPKTLNPELPDVLNFIVAKALAKNLDDRYASAKVLAHDLREVIASGEAQASPADLRGLPQLAPFVQPASPLTRHEDKADRILAAAGGTEPTAPAEPHEAAQAAPVESTQPSLGLSEAFDNFSATMRLAALTGSEKELDQFSETQKIARLKALAEAKRSGNAPPSASDSTTWRQPGELLRPASASGGAGLNLKLVWIGSAVLAAAALALFALR